MCNEDNESLKWTVWEPLLVIERVWGSVVKREPRDKSSGVVSADSKIILSGFPWLVRTARHEAKSALEAHRPVKPLRDTWRRIQRIRAGSLLHIDPPSLFILIRSSVILAYVLSKKILNLALTHERGAL